MHLNLINSAPQSPQRPAGLGARGARSAEVQALGQPLGQGAHQHGQPLRAARAHAALADARGRRGRDAAGRHGEGAARDRVAAQQRVVGAGAARDVHGLGGRRAAGRGHGDLAHEDRGLGGGRHVEAAPAAAEGAAAAGGGGGARHGERAVQAQAGEAGVLAAGRGQLGRGVVVGQGVVARHVDEVQITQHDACGVFFVITGSQWSVWRKGCGPV